MIEENLLKTMLGHSMQQDRNHKSHMKEKPPG